MTAGTQLGAGCGEQALFQRLIRQLTRQWPAECRGSGPGQIILHGGAADADLAGGNAPSCALLGRMRYGSSPRGRGTHVTREQGHVVDRCIPARAGNACARVPSTASEAVHPHAGGNAGGRFERRRPSSVHPRPGGERFSRPCSRCARVASCRGRGRLWGTNRGRPAESDRARPRAEALWWHLRRRRPIFIQASTAQPFVYARVLGYDGIVSPAGRRQIRGHAA